MAIFKADGTGKWGLYSGTDDLPFDSPRSHMSRVHGHSDFDYLAFASGTPTFAGTIDMPTSVPSLTRTIVIGAHGKSGIPFVFAQCRQYATAPIIWVPLVGTVPVKIGVGTVGGLPTNLFIAWTLALSATEVAIVETRTLSDWNPGDLSRDYRIWVSDNIMD